MKVEFEINDNFTTYPEPKVKMIEILSAAAKLILAAADETLLNVKIDGEDVPCLY